MRFHPRTIAKLRRSPTTTQVDYYDDEEPGFGLRINPGGTATWFVVLRINGDVARFKLGRYENLLYSDARRRARKLKGKADEGIDPRKEKYRRQEMMRVPELHNLYISYYKKKRRAWRQVDSVLRRDVVPRFRHHAIDEVTKGEIIQLLDKLDKRAPGAARKALEAVRQMFNFAIKRGLIAVNPAALLEAPSPKNERKRYLFMEEITRLIENLVEEPYPVAASMLMILLTLSRENEILALRRSTIAQKQGYLTVEETKNYSDHNIPVGRLKLVSRLIDKQIALYPAGNDEFLFPSEVKAGVHLSGSHLLRRFKEVLLRAGVNKAWLHDLRRSAATHLARLGVRKEVITKLLNQGGSDVTDIYVRWDYWPERVEALIRWEAELLSYPEIKKAIAKILKKEA
jgi:site-specific recombinase XerD